MPSESEPPTPASLADGPRFPAVSIAAAPMPSVEVQQKHHVVVAVNDAFCDLLGESRDNILGRPFAQLAPGGELCVPVLDGVYETGKAKAYAQAHSSDTADDSDSSGVYWLYAMWPALDASDQRVGVIIQLTRAGRFDKQSAAVNGALLMAGLKQHELREDAEALNAQLKAEIAERRKTEVALTETLHELQRAQWAAEQAMRAKDSFLAALSHELRTPLTPVLLMASALAEDSTLPADTRKHLRMMRRNIELQGRLIDDLLDITRITHGKLRISAVVTDVHEILRFTDGILRHESVAPTVNLVFALDASRHHALVDPARLQQVFWNVLRNALKFTPSGGNVTVSSRNDDAGTMIITVEDTGIGISPEALAGVFNAFDQGKGAGKLYGGLGMGLFIAQAIITEHAGTIRAESAGEGLGTTVTITLPTVIAPTVEPKPLAPPPRGAGRALRILVVEDHETTLSVLARLLTMSGHRITTAATAQAALTAYSAETFDAVISDLGLPDGNGVELMEKIQRIRTVPAIALSGYGMGEDLERTRKAGFFTHLVKPVDLEELLQALDGIPVSE